MPNPEERLQNFWNGKIQEIYDQFIAELDRKPKYCELCEVSFHRGTPNYASVVQQQLYLLRYFSAYLFEYFEAFNVLNDQIDEHINIVSFGCGSGIDGAAAECVFPTCSYRGVDITQWDYWFPNGDYEIESASDFIPTNENVFVFPKSLNEFPPYVVERLAVNLPRTSAQNICIINSKRNRNDLDRCSHIVEFFGGNVSYSSINSEESALCLYHNWFNYPNNVRNSIQCISDSCPHPKNNFICCEHRDRLCSANAQKPMNRAPVLSDSNFSTDIYLIQR